MGAQDGRPLQPLVTGQDMPDGLDISIPAGKLFWTSMGVPPKNDGAVFSSNLDGSDVKAVVPECSVHARKQITLDHQNSKVYFSDCEGLHVLRCNFDGSEMEVLVRTGDWENEEEQADQTRWCVGIALSPATGKFYWTQKGPSKGSKGRILRANMDLPAGEDALNRTDVEFFFQNLPEPIDLEIDENMLWWTDRGELPLGNSINCVKLDKVKPAEGKATSWPGKDYHLFARNLHEAIGIKLMERVEPPCV